MIKQQLGAKSQFSLTRLDQNFFSFVKLNFPLQATLPVATAPWRLGGVLRAVPAVFISHEFHCCNDH